MSIISFAIGVPTIKLRSQRPYKRPSFHWEDYELNVPLTYGGVKINQHWTKTNVPLYRICFKSLVRLDKQIGVQQANNEWSYDLEPIQIGEKYDLRILMPVHADGKNPLYVFDKAKLVQADMKAPQMSMTLWKYTFEYPIFKSKYLEDGAELF